MYFFYPKNCGFSQSEFLREPGRILKSEQCNCLGQKYSATGDRFGFVGVSDSGNNYYCTGIPLGKVCYEKTMLESGKSENWKQVSCS